MQNGKSIAAQADAVANRLRLRQAEFADDAPEVRAQFIEEEIRTSMQGRAPSERAALLQALLQRFPEFGGVTPTEPDRPEPRTSDDPADHDPVALAEELAAVAPKLTAEAKTAVIARLQAAGLVEPGAIEVPEKLAKLLQLKPNEAVEAGRLMQALVLFTEVLTRLDDAVWIPWGQIAPDSDIQRGAVLRTALARYLRGESTDVAKHAGHMMKLAAALMTALTRVGRALFDEQFGALLPDKIEEEHAGGMMGGASKCWKQYKTMAEGLNAPSFEAEFYKKIEGIVRGLL
jgi:hypothetical protein